MPVEALPANAVPPASSSCLYAKVESQYVKKVRAMYSFLKEKNMVFFANVFVTFLTEPLNAFYAAYLLKKSLNRKKITQLNPTFLSPSLSEHSPVLFIHGDWSNSGLFAPMIEQVAKDCPNQPVFTIDLTSPDGIVSEKSHLQPIVNKVKEIVKLYPPTSSPKVLFVGHSSGGDVLPPLIQALKKEQIDTGTIIKVGSIFDRVEAENFCSQHPGQKAIEIGGTRDVFEGCESHLQNRLVVAAGHLGLLFNQAVLKRVSEEIRFK